MIHFEESASAWEVHYKIKHYLSKMILGTNLKTLYTSTLKMRKFITSINRNIDSTNSVSSFQGHFCFQHSSHGNVVKTAKQSKHCLLLSAYHSDNKNTPDPDPPLFLQTYRRSNVSLATARAQHVLISKMRVCSHCVNGLQGWA